jgi:uncharacterized protein
MRIVLDTNILVRTNVKARGPSHEILLTILRHGHTLINSPFLLRETERVLTYPRLQRLWQLTTQDIQEHIDLLEKFSSLVHPVIEASVVLKDPNDDPIIYTAVAGKADVLCTLDQHFYDSDVVRFAKRRGIRILTDLQLLSELGEGQGRLKR